MDAMETEIGDTATGKLAIGNPVEAEISALQKKIEQLESQNSELRRLLNHSPLTALPIRRLFSSELERAIERNRHRNRTGQVAVAVLRLDQSYHHIRDTRDRNGVLLFKTVLRIKEVVPQHVYQSDRFDEFLIILENIPNQDMLELLLQDIAQRIGRHHAPPADDIAFGCNIGASMHISPDMVHHHLVENAFIALEESERDGAFYIIYDHKTGESYRHRQLIKRELIAAVKNGFRGFQVYYQPIVEGNGTICGAEALIRWRHSDHGYISPAEFIPIAESSGYIRYIDQWMLYNVSRRLGKWYHNGGLQVTISLNISPTQFYQPGLIGNIDNLLQTYDLPPGALKIEVTEGVMLGDSATAIRTMEGLRDLGVRLSLDDFGTGYSSLNYLRQFPIDTLKIDKSFMDDIESNVSNRAIVQAILLLVRNLKLTVLAEGTETAEQVRVMADMGCNYFQGYYFAKPCPQEQFFALLARDVRLPL